MMLFTQKSQLGKDCKFTLSYDDAAKKLIGFEVINNSGGKLDKADFAEKDKIAYSLKEVISDIEWQVTLGI